MNGRESTYFVSKTCLILVLLLGATIPHVAAQESDKVVSEHASETGTLPHLSIMADIFAECAAPLLSGNTSFSLDMTTMSESLGREIVHKLTASGNHTFSTSTSDPALSFDVAQMGVRWEPIGRKILKRHVSASIETIVQIPSGETRSASCAETRTDQVARGEAAGLGDPDIVALQPAVPSNRGLRAILQPMVLVGASAVGTYLLFNLRSRRADGG